MYKLSSISSNEFIFYSGNKIQRYQLVVNGYINYQYVTYK